MHYFAKQLAWRLYYNAAKYTHDATYLISNNSQLKHNEWCTPRNFKLVTCYLTLTQPGAIVGWLLTRRFAAANCVLVTLAALWGGDGGAALMWLIKNYGDPWSATDVRESQTTSIHLQSTNKCSAIKWKKNKIHTQIQSSLFMWALECIC